MTANAEYDFVADALPAFISEANEQIAQLEQLLLELEDAPDSDSLLNALFRCAHTVKGSAGVFGLDALVAFAHHMETLLDGLRAGRLRLTPAMSTLLLKCNDQVRVLVAEASGQPPDPDAAVQREDLVAQLQAAAGAEAGTAAPAAPEAAQAAGAAPRWHISAAFGRDTFRNGMDPLAVLHYLRGLGEVPRVQCDVDAIPPIEQLDPESCHLHFEFGLLTHAGREAIDSAFNFVREDCAVRLLAPVAGPSDFVAFIESMPDNPRLGDILVAAGAITHAQLNECLHVQRARAAVGRPALLGEVMTATATVEPRVVAAALQKQQRSTLARDQAGAAAGAGADDQRYIRVQANRLDDVIGLLGELVIAGAGAALLARQTKQRKLVEANAQINRLIEEIRNGTLQLRMVPIGETFARFRRVVRDTAGQLGKDVRLELVGSETELDKSVVERIADPLMHLVRNALDHGLESPDERAAAGKPPQGRLTLSACHEAGHIVIRIADDGRGIQRQKVLNRAWERGLLEPGVVPDDDAILRLIFQPGFSTAEQVTNLSGRGVGMDVVRSNIEALRGSVTLSSDEGRGSCVELRLPLTLAIIDGFLVGVGTSKFILPLEAVVEVMESRARDEHLDECGRGVVELRGRVLPVVNLRKLYALGGSGPERSNVVVLQAGKRRFGVLVDQLLGQHQTVIKPMARLFKSLRGMSGTSILGNGDVALIFDVHALCQMAAETVGRPSDRTRLIQPEGVAS